MKKLKQDAQTRRRHLVSAFAHSPRNQPESQPLAWTPTNIQTGQVNSNNHQAAQTRGTSSDAPTRTLSQHPTPETAIPNPFADYVQLPDIPNGFPSDALDDDLDTIRKNEIMPSAEWDITDEDELEQLDLLMTQYTIEDRGHIPVKGKGMMHTYFADIPPAVVDSAWDEDSSEMTGSDWGEERFGIGPSSTEKEATALGTISEEDWERKQEYDAYG